MADILIKGMKMPKSCGDCQFRDAAWCILIKDWRKAYNVPPKGKKLPDCPLIEIPDKHGRLIDADAFLTALNYNYCKDCTNKCDNCDVHEIIGRIEDETDTVLEATE